MMQKHPKVSIGMPVYNGADFIRRALDSVMCQTFTDFELIISDNASDDETEIICREYAAKDNRISYFRQKTNIGGTDNFRFVLNKAKSSYFCFLAHDDWWEGRDYLQKLYDSANLNEDAGLVIPRSKNYNQVGSNAQFIEEQGLHDGASGPRWDLNLAILKTFGVGNPFYGLYNLNVINNLPDIIMDCRRDWCCFSEGPLMHYIYSRFNCVYVDDACFCYFIHPKSVSKSQRSFDLMTAYVKYSKSTFLTYLTSDYPLRHRIKILAYLFPIHTKYSTYLVLSSLKQIMSSLFSQPQTIK
jgi:glycosyltransferase involved in cell wall biosynthesis